MSDNHANQIAKRPNTSALETVVIGLAEAICRESAGGFSISDAGLMLEDSTGFRRIDTAKDPSELKGKAIYLGFRLPVATQTNAPAQSVFVEGLEEYIEQIHKNLSAVAHKGKIPIVAAYAAEKIAGRLKGYADRLTRKIHGSKNQSETPETPVDATATIMKRIDLINNKLETIIEDAKRPNETL